MDNNQCTTRACFGQWIGSAVVVFILLFGMGYLIHHVWLMPIYEQTANLWRPVAQMQEMMSWLFVYYAVLALAIAALFKKVKKGKMACIAAEGAQSECKIGGKHCPIKFGICFGAIIGILMGTQCAGSYIFMPLPGELAVKWFIADIVQGIVIGVVLSLICYCKNKQCTN